MSGSRIAVVGGGLAGLTAAYALAAHRFDVCVFEASDRLGGRAITDRLDGVEVDPGAQLFGSMYTRFLGLVRELGLGDRLVRVPGRDALWRGGRAHEVVYGSIASMVASGGLPFRTKMRLGARYVPFLTRHAGALDVHAPEKAAAAGLDGLSISTWGDREIDREFVDYLVYPQLGAFYGCTPEETSAGFYHILARDGMDVALFAVDGGVGRVAERLAEAVRARGGKVLPDTPVEGVEVSTAGAVVESARGAEDFDALVSAVPAPVLVDILAAPPEPLREWLSEVRYRPSLSLALVLGSRRRERYFGLSFPRGATRYVSVLALQENKGVTWSHPGGLLVAFATPESAPDLVDLSSREVLDRMLPEVRNVFPEIDHDVSRARVYRWPTGAPVFYPGYLGRLDVVRDGSIEAGLPLALAGDFLYGPSVEGAVMSGYAAADRVRRWSAPR